MNVAGVPRVRLDFLSQLIDEDAQIFGLLAVIGAPDRLQQLAVRDGFIGVQDQVAEKVELLGREPDFVAGDDDLTGAKIDLDVVEKDMLRSGIRGKRRTAQRGANARQQLGHAEGLGDEIVGSGIEGTHLILLAVANGQHDDGDFRGGPELAAHLQAAHTGHVHIEEHEVKTLLANFL